MIAALLCDSISARRLFHRNHDDSDDNDRNASMTTTNLTPHRHLLFQTPSETLLRLDKLAFTSDESRWNGRDVAHVGTCRVGTAADGVPPVT